MKSFDEWYIQDDVGNPSLVDAFNAGAASRQAEVDELQKRIDVLKGKVNEMAHIFLDDLEEILKGNKDE